MYISGLISSIDPPPTIARPPEKAQIYVGKEKHLIEFYVRQLRDLEILLLIDQLRRHRVHVSIHTDPEPTFKELSICDSPAVPTIIGNANGRLEIKMGMSPTVFYLDAAHVVPLARTTIEMASQAGTPIHIVTAVDRPQILYARPAVAKSRRPERRSPHSQNFRWSTLRQVSLDEANNAFSMVDRESLHPLIATRGIPFLHPEGGCGARSHEMCRILKRNGFDPAKIWHFGPLLAKTKNDPCGHVTWLHHTAAVLAVNTGDRVEPMVIDPALFPSVTTESQWLQRQREHECPKAVKHFRHCYTRAKVIFPHPDGFKVDDGFVRHKRDLERWRWKLIARSVQMGPPPY